MRSIFTEHDLISAEIQNINSDGTLHLHTRSLKYGKLENGCFLRVASSLVPRLPQHFVSLDCGVDVLLGVNGGIWVTRTMPREWLAEVSPGNSTVPEVEALSRLQRLHASTPISPEVRLRMSRVRNALVLLAEAHVSVSPEHVSSVYSASESLKLSPAVRTSCRLIMNYSNTFQEMLLGENNNALLSSIK